MVRLKAIRNASLRANPLSFNSTMVRLKAELVIKDGGKFIAFQFHNGSIKSLLIRFDPQRIPGFNSTMVRLKEALQTELDAFLSEFQFHNGSIKSVSTRFRCRCRSCFNSTMVRLKERSQFATLTMITSFNSTMVRLKARSSIFLSRHKKVSIPQWFD